MKQLILIPEISDFLKYLGNLVISRNGQLKQLFHDLAEIINYFMKNDFTVLLQHIQGVVKANSQSDENGQISTPCGRKETDSMIRHEYRTTSIHMQIQLALR